MKDNYVSIKSLRVDYLQNKQALTALESVDLSLAEGETGVIIGPSGCGKSTLLNILAGLNSRYAGKVLIDGRPPVSGGETALILHITLKKQFSWGRRFLSCRSARGE